MQTARHRLSLAMALCLLVLARLASATATPQALQNPQTFVRGTCAVGALDQNGNWDCVGMRIGSKCFQDSRQPDEEIAKLAASVDPISDLKSLMKNKIETLGLAATLEWMTRLGPCIETHNAETADSKAILHRLADDSGPARAEVLHYITVDFPIGLKTNQFSSIVSASKIVKETRSCYLWIFVCKGPDQLSLKIGFTPAGLVESIDSDLIVFDGP